ncbi:MAG: DUF58 domain-containing protein [Acidobacteria bacterium]|nr:MAG: DUF58 domain-containing protein [Acidobacteriota bacterium]REK08695.1 MAG: DUF58 domain-containing protein [Acidobacteriota bacterium]
MSVVDEALPLPSARPRGFHHELLGALRPGRRQAPRSPDAQHVVERQCSLTKVGLWYLLFLVVLVLAASNTGNNALYMVIASMVALLAVSWVVATLNLRGVQLELQPPHEVFARAPLLVTLVVRAKGRPFAPRWLAVSTQGGSPHVVPRLDVSAKRQRTLVERRRSERAPSTEKRRRGAVARMQLRVLWPSRGRHRMPTLRVVSLYPLGLFRCQASIEPARTALVFPQLFDASDMDFEVSATVGESTVRRRGSGPELFGLRPFRTGDDPRSVHWKRSAQTGELVVLEREAEDSRRLSLLLDNAVPRGADEQQLARFELLVSEAATLAVDALERGFEVELVTRSRRVGYGTARPQRRRLLEALALLETMPLDPLPRARREGAARTEAAVAHGHLPALRASDASAWSVRLALADPRTEAAP